MLNIKQNNKQHLNTTDKNAENFVEYGIIARTDGEIAQYVDL